MYCRSKEKRRLKSVTYTISSTALIKLLFTSLLLNFFYAPKSTVFLDQAYVEDGKEGKTIKLKLFMIFENFVRNNNKEQM